MYLIANKLLLYFSAPYFIIFLFFSTEYYVINEIIVNTFLGPFYIHFYLYNIGIARGVSLYFHRNEPFFYNKISFEVGGGPLSN